MFVLFALSPRVFAADFSDIGLGSPAPSLTVEEWVQGAPILPGWGRVRVIEFWATWCGPCVAQIPHLIELQQKYSRKVTFVAMAASQRGSSKQEKLASLKEFMSKNGAKINYRVAFDSSGQSDQDWLEAAGMPFLPTAFVVDGKGVIVFIGSPSELDKVLPKVLNESWLSSSEYAEHKLKLEAQTGPIKKRADLHRRLALAIAAQSWLDIQTIAEDGRLSAADSSEKHSFEMIKLMALFHLESFDEHMELARRMFKTTAWIEDREFHSRWNPLSYVLRYIYRAIGKDSVLQIGSDLRLFAANSSAHEAGRNELIEQWIARYQKGLRLLDPNVSSTREFLEPLTVAYRSIGESEAAQALEEKYNSSEVRVSVNPSLANPDCTDGICVVQEGGGLGGCEAKMSELRPPNQY